MIRSDPAAAPRRRIAVIGIPRPQQTRLGMIRPARAGEPIGWCTISDEAPESSSNFLASAMMRQRIATQQTPGTLLYTPAATGPNTNLAPWNSQWTKYRSRQLDLAVSAAPAPAASSGGMSQTAWFALTVAASVTAAAIIAKGKK